jgi:hypothetical protein
VCIYRAHGNYFFAAAPSSGLYFTLNNTVYLPGDTVLITDVGVFANVTRGGAPVDPGTSLVCRTEHINTQCCRGSDGGNAGEWFDPDGNLLPRFGGDLTADFSRSGYAQQVRLNRRNNAMSPTGAFECRVPPMGGEDLVVASITISTTAGEYSTDVCTLLVHSISTTAGEYSTDVCTPLVHSIAAISMHEYM